MMWQSSGLRRHITSPEKKHKTSQEVFLQEVEIQKKLVFFLVHCLNIYV